MGKLLSLQEVLEEEYEAIHGQPVPVRSEKLPALFTALHAKNQTALCLSGGGIRSATFALGVIQALAQRGSGAQSLLSKFHYLSTVSGGGYIGAWLSAYARRSGGIDEVADRLKAPPEDPANPEIKPIKHLRQFSNYLAPKLGFLSADTWTLIGTYLRNVSLTWLVLVPLFIAALMLPRFFVSLLRSEPHIGFVYLAAATAVVSYLLALWHLCKSRPVGDVPRYGNRRGDDARPYLTNGAFVWRAILPLLVCAVATSLAYGWCGHHRPKMPMWLIASIAVVISVVMSTYYMIRFRRAAKEGEELGNLRRDVKRKWFLRKKQAAELAAATISGLIGVAAAWSALTAHSFAPPFLPLKQPAAADWLNPATIFPPAGIALYVCFAVPILFGALIVQGTIFIAGASWFNEEYDREWWARAGAWCACAALAWMVITILALYGPVFIYYAPRTITGIGMISGGFAVLMGRSAKTAANRKQKEEEGLLGRSINLSLGLAVPVFAVCVLAALSLATTKLLQPFVSPPPMSVHDRNLLERTSWTYETKARKEPRLPLLDPGERTMKTIEMPAMEGDVFAARQHLYVVDHTDAGLAFLVIVFGVVLGGVASLFVGVNRFSMNALYRNRLIRAYLGASHMGRDPNPFTGFDPEDNMQLHELQPDFITAEDLVDAKAILGLLKKPPDHWLTVFAECVPKLTDLDQDSMLLDQRLARRLRDVVYERDLTRPWLPWLFPSEKTPLARVRNRRELEKRLNAGGEVICPLPRAPFHVINMALNLVGGKKELAWVERMAQSFTASPLHSGSESSVNRLGYRRSIEYGGPSGLSLGMAVSVSGAAASPNMGYHSSPALAFLMTFFNVRLGAWLGNPKHEKAAGLADPNWSLVPLVSEAVGETDADHPYIYLSDGGHFENLGLYEMVRRRCRWIVVCDAGEDPHFSFEDLGNAIRKIRIDFGIPITIKRMGLYPRPKAPDGKLPDNPKYCAWGTIEYTKVDNGDKETVKDGEFIYIKPVFYGQREPKDVFNYAMTNPAFPHESTLGDQFFSESQFESYRILGQHIVEEVCGTKPIPTPEAFVQSAKEYVERDDRGSPVKKFIERILE